MLPEAKGEYSPYNSVELLHREIQKAPGEIVILGYRRAIGYIRSDHLNGNPRLEYNLCRFRIRLTNVQLVSMGYK